jgi:hypothetical protein
MFDVDPTRLPDPLRALVESELQSGERVTWVGQPIPGRAMLGALPIVLFAIPWTAFSVFWIAGAAAGTAHSRDPGVFRMFPLFGLPFVLVGLGLLASPLWVRLTAKRTAYVITDRRAIVLAGGWAGSVTVRSFEPAQLTDLRRTQRSDGSGDLVFTQDVSRGNRGAIRTTDVGFLAIADVKGAEERVRALTHRA